MALVFAGSDVAVPMEERQAGLVAQLKQLCHQINYSKRSCVLVFGW
jgi:hypothetical protein